jgi:serine/threonine-protein kinase RsbT
VDERVVTVVGEDGIVLARQEARRIAKEMGFGLVDQSRIATAVSELTRNVVRYAVGGRGEMVVRRLEGAARGMEIVVRDEGPGIDDVEQAMREGFTSGQGLGLGLPGTKRLVDQMEIDSALGRGTVVTIRKWLR